MFKDTQTHSSTNHLDNNWNLILKCSLSSILQSQVSKTVSKPWNKKGSITLTANMFVIRQA